MLSVNDPRTRTRSRSRDGGRDRSRSRDARAPSPARRSKQAYESDSEALEDDSDADRRYARHPTESDRYQDPRYDDRHRSGREYEAAVVKSRHREESFDQEYRGQAPGKDRSTYGRDREREREYRESREHGEKQRPSESSKYEHARPTEYTRHMSYSRPGEEREYQPPGAYEEYDEHDKGRTRHLSLNTSGGFHMDIGHEPPKSPRTGSYYQVASPTSGGGKLSYAQPGKYEYAKAPQDVRYLSRTESHGHGPQYIAKPAAEIEIERRRHKREDEEERVRREYEEEKYRRQVAEYERKTGRKYDHKTGRTDESDEDEYKYHRKKHSDEEREKQKHSKKYIEVDAKLQRRPSHSRRESKPEFVEIIPGGSSLKPVEQGVRRLSVSGGHGALTLAAPGGQHHPGGMQPGGRPPGSPLLEAYRGTWQSISPMPSPMALPAHMDDGLSDLEPLEGPEEPDFYSDDSGHRKPRKSILKKVVIYDPEPDAKAIAAELKHSKPEAGALIKILPPLSDDNMMALRAEYKKHFKAAGKGINVAKHIKVKYTGNIGKIAYATALGRWESEAHWANFWYQSGSSRRELLIESLIGRSNLEIKKIKEAFSDKRYNDSLEKCMQTELKKDKFRHAVLTALEEKRMDELTPLSRRKIKEDVENLYKALVAKEGGETAMIDIILVGSDTHLREVLKEFETKYRRNFAREMIQKSQNLVVSPPSFLTYLVC